MAGSTDVGTMNNYILLDGKKYACVYKQWSPMADKPMMVRYAWDGTIDVTYGPGTFLAWRGVIMVATAPNTGYGSVSDIRTTLAKRLGVNFTDHYGNAHTVHIQQTGEERSYSPKWNSGENSILFPVQIYAEA
jgi:hypothetical protein